MFKPLFISILVATTFISTPVLARDNDEAENGSDRTYDEKSSRGSVTQGVIGAEADENKKLVPESTQGTDENDETNIREGDSIPYDAEPSTLEDE